jgi:hypothetical protein
MGWILALPLSFLTAQWLSSLGYGFWTSFFIALWNYWLCRFSSPDLDHITINLDEGEGMRFLEKIWFIGWILRALWLSYTTLYAGIILAFGGHRSVMSHSLILGTGLRIIFLNIPFYFILDYWYGIDIAYVKFGMDKWIIPYFVAQGVLWTLGDAIHLLLDTEIVKGILYKPESSRKGNNGLMDKFKPKYKEFVRMSLLTLFSYFHNYITKIFRKRR